MKLLKVRTFIAYFMLFFTLGCINTSNNINPSKPSTPVPTNIGGDFVPQIFTVSGYIYDKENKPLPEVKVTIKWLNNQDKHGYDSTESITDSTGYYVFRGIYHDTDVEITASKDGYSTVTRNVTINIDRYAEGKYFINFGGKGDEIGGEVDESQYALEKIN